MDLYIIRHAEAEAAGTGGDDARPLTARGKKRFAREVEGLAALGVRFDRVYHSPMRRAVETAELLLPVLGGESSVTSNLARAPDEDLLEEIRSTPSGRGAKAAEPPERVALVGHLPWLADLAAWLLTGAREHGAALDLKKGGVIWLDGEPRPRGMTLRGFLFPKILTRLGGEEDD